MKRFLPFAVVVLLMGGAAAGARQMVYGAPFVMRHSPFIMQAAQSASRPASRPQGPVLFQPGVRIDWNERAVRVDAHVALREGPLEFFACFGGKEHESVLRLDATAVHIYMALGLLGMTPGHPSVWDETRNAFGPPAGDLVDVSIEWVEDGRPRAAAAFDWLREIEYDRAPRARPWVFAGSQMLPDKTLLADKTGAGLALVDFSENLLALSRGHISRDADLWVVANTAIIPPRGAPVQVVLRPARPPSYQVALDFRGAASVDGHYVSAADLADLLLLARQLKPDFTQIITTDRTLRGDLERWRQFLAQHGLPAEAFRFVERN